MTTHSTKYFVIVALTLSLLLHLITAVPVMWDGDLSWETITALVREKIHQLVHPDTPDQVLERKKAKAIPHVTLKLGSPPASQAHMPNIMTIRLIHDIPPAPKPVVAQTIIKPHGPAKAKPMKRPLPSAADQREQASSNLYDELMNAPSPKAVPPADDSVNSTIQVALDSEDKTDRSYSLKNSLIDDSTVHIEASAEPIKAPKSKIPIPTNEPPTFPVQLQATYRTSVNGFGVNLDSEWRMEGRRYNVTQQGSVFGFHGIVSSDGNLTEQGLQPEYFQISINNKVWRFAKFDRQSMIMTYGRTTKPKTMPFNNSIQDITSLGFQMALAYGDKAQDIQLTMGTGIYNLHFELTDEELLKLPVGKVRTIRVKGVSSGGNSVVTADVWLAPDYRNMPVKIRVNWESYKIELSLSSLAIEGKTIFGKKPQAAPEQQTMPSNFAPKLEGTPDQLPQLPDEF